MKVIAKSLVNDGVGDDPINQHIRPNATYYVIGYDDECYRIINDLGEPILYPKELFDVVDPNIPCNWIKIEYEDGEYHVAPPELSMPGFYEDYFDGVSEAVEIFNKIVNRETKFA